MPDQYWISEFRDRMARFGSSPEPGTVPVSVKVRVTSGCFHREHSPEAYRIIDGFLSKQRPEKKGIRFEEHESGPEILAYIAAATVGLGLTKGVIDLVVTILKARSEGIRKGDSPRHDLELIVRRIDRRGEYAEEKILRVSSTDTIDAAQLTAALEQQPVLVENEPPQKKKSRRRFYKRPEGTPGKSPSAKPSREPGAPHP